MTDTPESFNEVHAQVGEWLAAGQDFMVSAYSTPKAERTPEQQAYITRGSDLKVRLKAAYEREKAAA